MNDNSPFAIRFLLKTKTAANQRKTAYSGCFGTPGETRTHYIPLRRRTLYPGEVRGLIQQIFNFRAQQDSNELPLRRRTLYPAELQRLIWKWNWRLSLLAPSRLMAYNRRIGACYIHFNFLLYLFLLIKSSNGKQETGKRTAALIVRRRRPFQHIRNHVPFLFVGCAFEIHRETSRRISGTPAQNKIEKKSLSSLPRGQWSSLFPPEASWLPLHVWN